VQVITENDVIELVSDYLRRKSWKIIRTATTIQHGPDVVAQEGSGREIWIEAKGQTLSLIHI